MPRSNEGRKEDDPKPRAVRRSREAPVVADTGKRTRAENRSGAAPASHIPPPNARVIRYSPVKGTVSRAAVRAAVKRLKDRI